MTPAAAQVQCNTAFNPAPPPARTDGYSNRSFGNPPTLSQYYIILNGFNGCGADGFPGAPGQPGGQVASVNTGLTIVGGFALPFNAGIVGVNITNAGGTAGAGGESGGTLSASQVAGTGGLGDAGGPVTTSLNARFIPDTFGLADSGLYGPCVCAPGPKPTLLSASERTEPDPLTGVAHHGHRHAAAHRPRVPRQHHHQR